MVKGSTYQMNVVRSIENEGSFVSFRAVNIIPVTASMVAYAALKDHFLHWVSKLVSIFHSQSHTLNAACFNSIFLLPWIAP